MDFKHCFIVVNKIWVHYYTPEKKLQLKQSIENSGSATNQARTVPSSD